MNLNHCTFIGRLGKDPELKYSQSGNAMCLFSIAVSEKWTDKQGEKQESTEWINCSVFGKQAETSAKFLSKGGLVHISGKFKTRKWEKEGVTHYSSGITVDRVIFGPKNESSGTNTTRTQYTDTEGNLNDLPF